VLATAVRRLNEDVVRLGQRRGVAQDRRPGAAEIAREDEVPFLAAVVIGDAQLDDRRAEDVAGVDEGRVDPWRDLEFLAVAGGAELSYGQLRVIGRVQGRIEVDIEVWRLGAEVGLGVARPGAIGPHGLDGRRDVLAARGRVAELGTHVLGVAGPRTGRGDRGCRSSRRRWPSDGWIGVRGCDLA
jgi:hypothetical protein